MRSCEYLLPVVGDEKCGKPARLSVKLDTDGDVEDIYMWFCAKHYDMYIALLRRQRNDDNYLAAGVLRINGL